MSLSLADRQAILALLHQEVVPALGCTEPIAVALTAARAAEALGRKPERLDVAVSANLLKNGMGVMVPGTGEMGLAIAAAAGALGGKSALGLECLASLDPAQAEAARAMVAADAVAGNLNRLFLVVCFGLGASTAVMIGKAIGEGQSHDELMDLSRTLSWVTILVGAVLAVIALALVPLLFQPVIFPLFKLYNLSAHLATTLAVTGFACIPFHAYSISAVTGILRAGGDVFWSTALDLAPQWLVALPLTALLALVLDADPWFVSLAIQAESFIKCPICLWRIRSRKWIHDVTLPEGER